MPSTRVYAASCDGGFSKASAALQAASVAVGLLCRPSQISNEPPLPTQLHIDQVGRLTQDTGQACWQLRPCGLM